MTEEREALDALLEIMRRYELDALTVRVGERAYELVLRARTDALAAPPAVAGAEPPPPPPGLDASRYKKVTAPVIGVFYRSASPGAEPFVETGDRVEAGQVLCILEAMKLMNEITSDYAGVVRRILPENGALVSLDEELFWIEL